MKVRINRANSRQPIDDNTHIEYNRKCRIRSDGRTRCIFDNGTESTMLYRSLYKALLQDGFEVSEYQEMEAEHQISDEDKQNGYIYVLSSLSTNPQVANTPDLYKIGFSRAFKEYHGITPSQAKQKNAKLNEYYPMNYLDMRYIGGKRIMAELKKIVYKEFEERLMVGVHNNTSFFEAGNAWKSYFESDKIDYLKSLSEFTYCEDIDENDGIGMMFNFQDTNTFELILGDFMRVNTPVPHDLYQKHIPSGTVACIQIEGNNITEIVDSAFLLITEAIEKTDQEIDFEQFYWCEIYTKERYSLPLSRGEKVVIDYILPVKSKKDE